MRTTPTLCAVWTVKHVHAVAYVCEHSHCPWSRIGVCSRSLQASKLTHNEYAAEQVLQIGILKGQPQISYCDNHQDFKSGR